MRKAMDFINRQKKGKMNYIILCHEILQQTPDFRQLVLVNINQAALTRFSMKLKEKQYFMEPAYVRVGLGLGFASKQL